MFLRFLISISFSPLESSAPSDILSLFATNIFSPFYTMNIPFLKSRGTWDLQCIVIDTRTNFIENVRITGLEEAKSANS